jgi:hypothetical protein
MGPDPVGLSLFVVARARRAGAAGVDPASGPHKAYNATDDRDVRREASWTPEVGYSR